MHIMQKMLVAVVFLVMPGMASGQVVLKPKGGAAMPLRVKAISARVSIERMLAATELLITFENETPSRIESDFLYTLPQDTQVTHFAYWYGGEEVVARVVEKERAAAIYKHITTRMRDPALIEMVGKNTFRARIFPVMPNADLKVKIHTVERLKTDAQGALYSLPLKLARGETLDRLDIETHVVLDGSFSKLSNNFGLPQTTDADGAHTTLTATNFRPQQDFLVRLARETKALRAVLYAARSGGRDGFFTLAVTPSRAISNATVFITGVSTYSVNGALRRTIPAHSTMLLTGRYRGSGPAAVTLKGTVNGRPTSLSVPVTFTDAPIQNNPAAKLWASARIAILTAQGDRSSVIALSRRHTLPSKFTSWLAIPVEERERYKVEKAMADASILSSRIAMEIAKRTPSDRVINRLYADIDRVFRAAKINRDMYLQNLFSQHTYDKAREIAHKFPNRNSNYRRGSDWRALVRLCRFTKQNPADEVEGARSQVNSDLQNGAYNEIYRLAPTLADEVLAGRGSSKNAKQIRARLTLLCRKVGSSTADHLRSYMHQKVGVAAWDVAKEERIKHADASMLRQLRDRFDLLSKRSGLDRQEMLTQARQGVRQGEIHQTAKKLVQELAEGRFESEAAREARVNLARLAAETGATRKQLTADMSYYGLQPTAGTYTVEVVAGRGDGQAARTALERFTRVCIETGIDAVAELRRRLQESVKQFAGELTQLRHQPRPDRIKLAALGSTADRLSRAGKFDLSPIFDPWERPYRTDIALRLRDQIIAEYRKEQPDPAVVKSLERRFVEATSSSDKWSKDWAAMRVQRLAIEAELDRLTDAQLSTQRSSRVTELEARLAPLRARMGDPLITVDAPADARQVVAIMPDGEIKPLVYDATKRRWEARFDIPTHASEGEYKITVIVVQQNGSRQVLAFTYHMDITAPAGQASVMRTEGEVIRLEVETSADTARVEALMPSGKLVTLKRSPGTDRFFALANEAQTTSVVFILTDRAHNRSSITVDLNGGDRRAQ